LSLWHVYISLKRKDGRLERVLMRFLSRNNDDSITNVSE